MCKYFSVYSISRMFVAADIALVGLSGIGYVVLIFAHGLIRERIVRAEFGGGSVRGGEAKGDLNTTVTVTQGEVDALNQRVETIYFPLLYTIGAFGQASFVGLTMMLHRAVKKEQINWLRLWALIHGLLLLVGLAASIWIMDHDRRVGLEHLVLVGLLLYRLCSIMVIVLLSLVVRYTLEYPECERERDRERQRQRELDRERLAHAPPPPPSPAAPGRARAMSTSNSGGVPGGTGGGIGAPRGLSVVHYRYN